MCIRDRAIVDALLSNWAGADPLTGAGTCGYDMMNASTTACGDQLVDAVAELVERGVDLLNGMIAALGVLSV